MKRKVLWRNDYFSKVYKVFNCKGMTKIGLLAFCDALFSKGGEVKVDEKGNGFVTVYK